MILKPQSENKETNYSLYNVENYYHTLEADIGDITSKYSELLIEYYKFVIENIKSKNKAFLSFIITRGLDTITNVFYTLLYYTKNQDLTYFHCQKAFYFYVEFVRQISEDDKMFLQLTSRDASIYVYKKTLFEINNEFKKISDNLSQETSAKFTILNSYINLYKTLVLKVVQSKEPYTSQLLENFETISSKLNNIKISNKYKISVLENLVEKLFHEISDLTLFFEINKIITKKFAKKPETLNILLKKLYHEDFTKKILESHDKFLSWFII